MENSFVENAIDQLKKRDYRDTIIVSDGQFMSKEQRRVLEKKYLFIDAALHFENDARKVYAIASPIVKVKGILIEDGIRNQIPGSLIGKLPIESHLFKNDGSELIKYQYGMRKIFLDEFDADPENFELRGGFENFPACPFGNQFKVLGYDKANKEYVRFVKAILKNHALKTINPLNY
ncbi:MAG: hypothetical protein ACI8ZM_002361 [Crocinitomix sp.]|jgi:hypothetical protein